jgi:hypothetical protein
MLFHKPCVPTPSEGNSIHTSEWLALALPLGAERRYARIDFCFPLVLLRFCFAVWSVTRNLEMGFAAVAVELGILVADVLRNDFASKPSTVLSPI